MDRVLADGEQPRHGWMAAIDELDSPFALGRLIAEHGEPEYGTIAPVTPAEAKEHTGVERLTRAHLDAIDDLAEFRVFGRCAILHDETGTPTEIYFWGHSGD